MEFSSNQCFNFFCCRRRYVCEAVDNCIYKATSVLCAAVARSNNLLCLTDDKSELEGKFVVIVELEYKVRGGARRRFRVLGVTKSVSARL